MAVSKDIKEGLITSKELTSLTKITVKDPETNDGYSMLDILELADLAQAQAEKAFAAVGTFNKMLVLMAAEVGDLDKFGALLNYAERSRKWGRAPAGTPESDAVTWNKAPRTYTEAKSRLLSSWKSGIAPLSKNKVIAKVTEERDGKKVTVEKVVTEQADTVNLMVKARKHQDRLNNIGKEVAAAQPKPATNTDTNPLDDVLLENIELGRVISDIVAGFEYLTPAQQEKELKTLSNVAKRVTVQAKKVQAKKKAA